MCPLVQGPCPWETGLWAVATPPGVCIGPAADPAAIDTWISFKGFGYFSAGCVIRAGKIVETPGQQFPGWEPLGAGFLRLFPVLSKA